MLSCPCGSTQWAFWSLALGRGTQSWIRARDSPTIYPSFLCLTRYNSKKRWEPGLQKDAWGKSVTLETPTIATCPFLEEQTASAGPYLVTCLPQLPVIDFDCPLLAASTWRSNQNSLSCQWLAFLLNLTQFPFSLKLLLLFLSTHIPWSQCGLFSFQRGPSSFPSWEQKLAGSKP